MQMTEPGKAEERKSVRCCGTPKDRGTASDWSGQQTVWGGLGKMMVSEGVDEGQIRAGKWGTRPLKILKEETDLSCSEVSWASVWDGLSLRTSVVTNLCPWGRR